MISDDKVEVITNVSSSSSQPLQPPPTDTNGQVSTSCDFLIDEHSAKLQELERMLKGKSLDPNSIIGFRIIMVGFYMLCHRISMLENHHRRSKRPNQKTVNA